MLPGMKRLPDAEQRMFAWAAIFAKEFAEVWETKRFKFSITEFPMTEGELQPVVAAEFAVKWKLSRQEALAIGREYYLNFYPWICQFHNDRNVRLRVALELFGLCKLDVSRISMFLESIPGPFETLEKKVEAQAFSASIRWIVARSVAAKDLETLAIELKSDLQKDSSAAIDSATPPTPQTVFEIARRHWESETVQLARECMKKRREGLGENEIVAWIRNECRNPFTFIQVTEALDMPVGTGIVVG